MYLKEMLAIKTLIMKKLEDAVDEMLEQYHFNQIYNAEKIRIDKDGPPDPNYLRPEKFTAKLLLDFESGNQMGFSQISCQPSFTIPDKDELILKF